jgi:hypothetical protein
LAMAKCSVELHQLSGHPESPTLKPSLSEEKTRHVGADFSSFWLRAPAIPFPLPDVCPESVLPRLLKATQLYCQLRLTLGVALNNDQSTVATEVVSSLTPNNDNVSMHRKSWIAAGVVLQSLCVSVLKGEEEHSLIKDATFEQHRDQYSTLSQLSGLPEPHLFPLVDSDPETAGALIGGAPLHSLPPLAIRAIIDCHYLYSLHFVRCCIIEVVIAVDASSQSDAKALRAHISSLCGVCAYVDHRFGGQSVISSSGMFAIAKVSQEKCSDIRPHLR